MVEASLTASAVLTGLIVLGILAALTLTRRRHPTLLGQDAAGSGFISERQQTRNWAGSTDALFVAFALLTLGAFGTAVLYVQGGSFTDPTLVLVVAATGIGLLLGSYSLAESAGLGSAGAVFVTVTLLGVLLLAIIAANLISG